jgi:hypothetical protein
MPTDNGKSSRAGDVVRSIAVGLRAHLRSHVRLLAADEESLLQLTIADLQRLLARQGPDALAPDTDLPALAHALFERRISDLLRERSREEVLKAAAGLSVDDATNAPGDPRLAERRRQLRAVLVHLASMDEDDRALLLSDVDPTGPPEIARAEAEHKRLSRLRRKLAQALETESGPSLGEFLGDAHG